MPLSKTITVVLVAAVSNGISTSQSGTAGTALTITGSLATSGVATFDVARRVIVTSAGNDSSNSFTITGTDRYGRTQVEVITGGNATFAQTLRDFKTVTKIVPTSNTASTVTAGTNGVASSDAWIVDSWANPQNINYSVVGTGATTTYIIETATDDFSPQWDLNANVPNWVTSASGSTTALQSGQVTGPNTMLRLTVTGGTGTVTAKLVQAFIAGRA